MEENREQHQILNGTNNNPVVTRLQDLRDGLTDIMETVFKPKLSMYGYVTETLKLDLTLRDKVILLDLLIHCEQQKTQKGTNCQQRVNMSRGEYNNGARSLANKGYIKQVKRGFYEINSIF